LNTASEAKLPSYPITKPDGCPSNVTRSVQEQCDAALRDALAGTRTEHLDSAARNAARDELYCLRRIVDGLPTYSDTWWIKWGFRTVTKAKEDAAHLAEFRDALAREDVSHVTHGHPVDPHTYNVYARDPKSPSGCHLIASASHYLPGVDQVLAASGRQTYAGGQRGNR
jgi:hypothetical protein